LRSGDTSSIAFGQGSLGFEKLHGVTIVSTLGDDVWDVYLERLKNEGKKTVTAIRFAYAVFDYDGRTRFDVVESDWVPVRAIRPSREANTHVKALNLETLQAHSRAAMWPSRHLDVVIYLTGVRYDDGTAWRAIDPKGRLQ
jgi:hypothetical protein